MPTAFLLITTETGAESEVLQNLRNVKGVEQAFSVYGVYDLIATIKADTMDKLKELITWEIRQLERVRSTLTMIVVEEQK